MTVNPRDPTIPFTAQHAGTCGACGHKFPRGASVRKRDSIVFHAGCSKNTTCDHTAVVDNDTTTVRCLQCKTRLPKKEATTS